MDDARSPLRLAEVGAEAVLIVGGGRAILLQLANPAIGHAVARHSDFVTRPLRRLQGTLTYVYALVYGTPAQVEAVRAVVNSAHSKVRSDDGTLPEYDATDARLQLWVAATLYDTAVSLRERLIGPLADADLDTIYRDYAVIGTALQVPEGMWPSDRAAFAQYWEQESLRLSVDDTVRDVSQVLLHPSAAPLWLRASMPLARLVTAGLLSPELRAAYGMSWGPRRERRFDRAMRVLAVVNRALPRRIREWPKNRLLRELR